MRGLRAITIGLAISLGYATAWGEPPKADPPMPPEGPQTESKPAPKVASVEYLKAGAKLFNKGDFKKAEPYFKASQRFRSELSRHEQVVLDTYMEELTRFTAEASRPRTDSALAPASLSLTKPAPKPADQPTTSGLRAPSRFSSTAPKQRARWMLQEAREFIRQGKYAEADQKVADARTFDVKWGRFDDTPDKVSKAIEYARTHASKTGRPPTVRPLGIRPFDSEPPADEAPAGAADNASRS